MPFHYSQNELHTKYELETIYLRSSTTKQSSSAFIFRGLVMIVRLAVVLIFLNNDIVKFLVSSRKRKTLREVTNRKMHLFRRLISWRPLQNTNSRNSHLKSMKHRRDILYHFACVLSPASEPLPNLTMKSLESVSAHWDDIRYK